MTQLGNSRYPDIDIGMSIVCTHMYVVCTCSGDEARHDWTNGARRTPSASSPGVEDMGGRASRGGRLAPAVSHQAPTSWSSQ